MRAAVFYGPHDVRLEERDVPSLGVDDVLIGPEYVGICGSDIEAFNNGGYAEGTVIGHEFVGTVKRVGSNVSTVKEGDYVTASAVWPCGICASCRIGRPSLCKDLIEVGIHSDGAMADFIRAPSPMVYKLPKTIDPPVGPLIDPLSNIVHAVRISTFKSGASVAVVGCGPIGLLLINFLKLSGASKIVGYETSPGRLQLASKLGADATVNPLEQNPGSLADSLTGGSGFDVVFVAAGAGKAAEMAYDLVGQGGEIIIVGIVEQVASADYLRMVLSELSVRGSYLGFNEYPAAIDLMGRQMIKGDSIVTLKVEGIERMIKDVFPRIAEPNISEGKVVVRVQGGK